MIDTETSRTPGWWIEVLATELHNRRNGRVGRRRWTRTGIESSKLRPPLTLLDDYRRGDPPLREDIHSEWAETFRQYVRMGRLNVADLLIASTGNRMGIRDFRTAAAADELGDAKARDIMRANKLKLVAREVHDDMLTFGDGYTMVTPPARPGEEGEYSLITAESPLQCITAHDPATGRAIAGLKMFRDDWDGADWAYLYLPGEVWVAYKPGATSLFGRGQFRLSRDWQWVEDMFDDVPGDRIPLVRFRNRRGVGEFEPHLDHLDRINDKLFNEWWISKIQAFRQRAVKNLPDTEERWVDGKKTEVEIDYTGMFTSSPDAMWQLPENAEIWESAAIDLSPLVNSVQKELQWLATATGRPLHTITPDAANGSAMGASTMKEEHIYGVEDRRDRAEGGWAETMSHAFYFQGDKGRADVTKIEPLWGPVERFSLQEKTQAARQVAGVLPVEAIYTDVLQYPPAEVANLRTLRGRDLLFQAPGQPARPGTPGPASTEG